MAIDTTPATVATDALSAIPFEAMIGGPLQACVQAQAMAAQTSWQFIQEVGLNPPDEDGNRSATQVTFSYQANGQMVNLNVPLLAIVPIPYLAVESCEIDFMANISAESSTVTVETQAEEIGAELAGSAKVGWGPFSAQVDFGANYSSKKESTATAESRYSVEYTLNVAVKAGQSDMPAGLAAVLNLLNSAIAATPVSGRLDVSPSVTSLNALDPSVTALIAAKVVDPDGMDAAGVDVTWTLTLGTASVIDVTVVSGTQKTSEDAEDDSGTTIVTTDPDGMAQVMVSLKEGQKQTDPRLIFDVSTTIDTTEHTSPVQINVFNAAEDEDDDDDDKDDGGGGLRERSAERRAIRARAQGGPRRRKLSAAERRALTGPSSNPRVPAGPKQATPKASKTTTTPKVQGKGQKNER